jgi:hypothetical protein
MVERLFKFRRAIEQTIANFDLTTFVDSMCGNHHHKSFTKAKAIQTNVKKDKFWHTCANFIHMVGPVVMSLKAFDGKQPCMGRVWLIMKTLE